MMTLVHQIDCSMLMSDGQEKIYLLILLMFPPPQNVQKICLGKCRKKRMTLMIPIGIGWRRMINE
ncbi:hypothetical protein KY284_007904 [Solanum tuberosum]|nr:hypothetical protein KY284_007904 [Solanum tuberosum]